jgi:hypothetical protein
MRLCSSVFAFVLALAVAAPADAQQIPSAHGLQLLPWASKIEEGRYKSPRSFEKTLKFFRDRYKRSSKVKIHPIVNLPGVKYIHFQSLNRKTRWSGFNLYEIDGKGVRLYVIKRWVPPPTPAEAPAKKSED